MARSLELPRQGSGWASGVLARLGRLWAGHRPIDRASSIDFQTWPDYMLKDVGLPTADRAGQERSDWRLLL